MEKLRIKELAVNNVGPFDNQHFVFPDKVDADKAEIHLITGENGTGKSTLLLMLASISTSSPLIAKRFKNLESSFNIIFSNNQRFICSAVGDNKYVSCHIPDFLDSYFNKISVLDFAFFAYSGNRKLNTVKLAGIAELTSRPLDNALNFEVSTNPQQLIQWIANAKTKEALALVKKEFSKANSYSTSISRIEKAISEIIDKQIEFYLEDDPLNVVIKVNNVRLEFDILPDGLKSIISWLSDLLMRLDRIKWNNDLDVLDKNFILLLDEIDIHLHPAWQRKILPVIQTLFKNAQIFITTHSPFVVGSVDGAWIHRLHISESGTNSITAPPILSEDAKSYDLILNEIFDIKGRFGLEVEKKLTEFRELRNRIIHERQLAPELLPDFKSLITYFNEQKSIEIDNLIGMEIRQLKRIVDLQELGV